MPNHFLRIDGQTRINSTIVDDSSGTSTSLYAPGPIVPPDRLEQLLEIMDFWLQAGRVLVLAGSLAPGVPPSTYADLIRRARKNDVRVILDCDGEAFRLGVDAGPDLIKPNLQEAEALLGRKLGSDRALAEGARELVGRGVGEVVISLGSRGALCVHGGRILIVRPPPVALLSTVGSGDSLVAGLAVAMARGAPLVEGLRLGTAAGAATAMTAGTALGTASKVNALVPKVQVDEVAF